MDLDTAVESTDDPQQPADDSSSDVRGAINAAIKEVNERTRDEQGRFAKANEQAAQAGQADAATAAATAATTSTTDPAAQQAAQHAGRQQDGQQAQQQAIKPPDAWSPAAKAKFAQLDPEIQQEVLRREAEVHKGFTAQDEHRNLGKQIDRVIAPYMPLIRQESGDPVKAVESLLQTAYTLRTANPVQKQDLLIGIANQYGIDLNAVFNRLAGGQSQVNPQVAQLEQRVAQLQQQLTQGSAQAQQAEEAQIAQTIERFASDPKNTFYADVKAEMAALLRAGRAKDLQEAYDMACWARPDIRPHLLQQQDQQRASDLKAKADKARLAGASIAGSPTGSAGAMAPQDRSLRDELRANLRAAMAE